MRRKFRRVCAVLSVVMFTVACAALPKPVAMDLPDAGGGHWGVSVVDLTGKPILEIASHERFPPASTLKLATTSAAFHYLGDFHNAGWPDGTSLYVERSTTSPHPSIVIVGSGDAGLSASQNCEDSCLSDLAQAVVEAGYDDVFDITYDDRLFETAHWPAGWSHDDLKFAYGTAISSLSVDTGVAVASLFPGPEENAPLRFEWSGAPAVGVDLSEAQTMGADFTLDLRRKPDENLARLSGHVPPSSPPVKLEFGLDDPAVFTAQTLRLMLRQRGIRVHGSIKPASDSDTGDTRQLLMQLPRPMPSNTLTAILHSSSNFDAEVLLHHISLLRGDKTQEQGRALVSHVLLEAGLEPDAFNIADGSGLSVYNRITPAGMTSLLVWAARQDWFRQWSALVPAAGDDGTLKNRLTLPSLDGRVIAKSGSLFGVDGLAGYFEGASGERFAFAIYIKDTSLSHAEARARIDGELQELVERY